MSENDASSEKAYDPGWNDPPLFSYETHQAFASNMKTSKPTLNRRVVHTFTLNNAIQQSAKDVKHEGGPPKASVSTLPAAEPNTSTELAILESISCKETLNNFTSVLDDLYSENDRETAEIKKRLDILENMWTDDKLLPEVQEKLFRMSSALKEGNIDEVNNLQRILMVDHARICSTWMAAVRKLINAKHNQKAGSTTG